MENTSEKVSGSLMPGQRRRARQRAKKQMAMDSLRRSLSQSQVQLKKSEDKRHYYKRKYEETTGELLDILSRKTHSVVTAATPTSRYHVHRTATQYEVIRRLQAKTIKPDMLQTCSDGLIGVGVFGTCTKAFLQGTVVCVKEMKDNSPQSKSALLHEAEMLSKLCHQSVSWLIAVQLQSPPYQLITPLYAIQGIPVCYHDILFQRGDPKLLSILHYFSSYEVWLVLLKDITEGLKYIHSLSLVYRDLKSDNIVLYLDASEMVHAVIIDFGKCLPESDCAIYSLSARERATYRESHRHISPDVVDGKSVPSAASDMYSLGRILNYTILHSPVDAKLWPECLKDICKQSLSHSSSARPSVNDLLVILEHCQSMPLPK